MQGRVREEVNHRVHRDHGADGAVAQKRCAHRVRRSAKINCQVKSAEHQAEPVGQFLGNLIEQERRWTEPQAPLPARAQQQSIEYERRSHRDLLSRLYQRFLLAIHPFHLMGYGKLFAQRDRCSSAPS
jgi:hypothetical protein